MGEIIAVTGRGGTGKSVCCANIAAALTKLDKKVMLIDCDLSMRTQDLIFGFENEVVYNFYDAATEKCSMADAVYKTEDGLKIMAAPQNMTIDEIDFDVFSQFLSKLKNAYDYVFLDCQASISNSLEKILKNADTMLIVCECDLRSARAGDSLATLGEKLKIGKNYLIINKLDIDTDRKNGIINSEELFGIVAVPPIGACPYDREINSGKVVIDIRKSVCGKAFKNIALRLTGEKVPVLYVKKKGLFR